jgi:hypothetical protein
MNDLAVALIASAAGTYVWRALGVVAIRRLDPESPTLLWVRAVATALIAALIVRFVYDPSGLLSETAFPSRALALAASVVGFFAAGRRIESGVGAGAGTLMLLEALRNATS